MQSTDNKNLFTTLIGAGAASGDITEIPATQAAPGSGRASINLGFPPETFVSRSAGGVPPFGADTNGLLNLLSASVQDLQSGPVFPYSAALSAAIGGYPLNAIVAGTTPGTFYVSTAENNTTIPGASGAFWQSLFAGLATVPTIGNDKSYTGLNSNTVLTASQAGTAYEVSAAGITITLPAPAQNSGDKFRFSNISSGTFVLSAGSGQIFFLGTAGVTSISVGQFTFIEVESDGTNWDVTYYSGGNAAVPYNVANATAPTNAVPLGQISSLTPGRLLNIRYLTTTTVYTPTTGTNSIIVELQAPGGASGGAPATNSGQNSSGGGGGSGAWARKRITSGFSGATITIGAPGVGSPGAPGTDGGEISFGTVFSANGGNGGQTAGPSGANTIFLAQSGLGGTAGTSGDLNVAGVQGAVGLVVDAQGIDMPQVAGMYAGSYGTGGAPVFAPINSPDVSGLPGLPGLCVIWEFS